jgi:hypothetical protein
MTTVKNQIKSYTSNSVKKEVTNFFVYLGGISGGTEKTDDSDISAISRITKNDITLVAPRINWTKGIEYEPYYVGSSGEKTYAYNRITDIVYLCVGKNQPTGVVGEQQLLSTEQPSHVVGTQQYSDGYIWLALYKLDLFLSKFLTETEMPINSLYDYTTEINSGSYVTKYNSLCGDAGKTGSCYFYYNEDTTDPVTSTIYYKGDRVLGIGEQNWVCSTCHTVGSLLNYKTIHIDGESSASEIKRNPLDELIEKINQNSIDFNDRFYIHYLNYNFYNNFNRGIVSLHLDFSNLTIEDRIVTKEKPEITILDPLGLDATANIETFYDIRRNAFVANGITLKTSGQNYINPTFNIPDSLSSKLKNSIKAVILPDVADPSTFLPNVKVSVIKQLSSSQLSQIETNQEIFTKVGIIKNVTTNDNISATSGLEPNQVLVGRTTTKLILDAVGLEPELGEIEVGEVYIDPALSVAAIKTDETTALGSDYTSKIVSVKTNYTGITATSAELEIAGVDELLFQLEENSSINLDGTEFNITDVVLPDYKIDNIEYVVTKNSDKNIVIENTGSETLIKLSFLI